MYKVFDLSEKVNKQEKFSGTKEECYNYVLENSTEYNYHFLIIERCTEITNII